MLACGTTRNMEQLLSIARGENCDQTVTVSVKIQSVNS